VITGSQREAVLTTPLCAGTVCHIGDLAAEERTLGNLLFLNQKANPNDWTARDMERMLDELNRFQPEHLEADPAYLAVLARYAACAGIVVHQPHFISLTYEFPSRLHRRQIRRAFGGVPLLSSYGSTEMGHVFTECEHGHFHQNVPFAHVDFQPLRPQHGQPSVGRILVTMLGNPWVYLLRFDVGDLVRLADAPCPCGRSAGLTLAAIGGRVRDVTFATNGRAVTLDQLDAALGEVPGLLAYQVEQQDATHYLLRGVSEPGAAREALAAAAAGLETLYGPGAEVSARAESAIMPEQSGKFRLARTRFAWDTATLF